MKKLIIYSVLIFIQGYCSFAFSSGAQNITDSLVELIGGQGGDTLQVKTLLELGDQFEYTNPDSALVYYQNALTLSEKINSKKYISKCSYYIGVLFFNQNKYIESLAYYKKALKIDRKIKNQKGEATNLANIGLIYFNQSNYLKALSYYQQALLLNEEINNRDGFAVNLGNLGTVYSSIGSYEKAVECYEKALEISLELGVESYEASNYENIGILYSSKKEYKVALEYYLKSLSINERLGDKNRISISLGNIGNVYFELKDYKISLEYLKRALELSKETGDQAGVAVNMGNIGSLYTKIEEYEIAIDYCKKSLLIAKEIGFLDQERYSYLFLSEAYKGLGKYKKSLEYRELWIEINDSIFNFEKSKVITEMTLKYNYEKRKSIDSIANSKQIEIKNIEVKKANNEQQQQQEQRNLFIGAFVIVFILAGFIFRSYLHKKKAISLLALQKSEIIYQRNEIEKQKELVELINNEVSQSINYAMRLQQAILPEQSVLENILADYFVLFKPKDKVSGDFYWWSSVMGKTVITAADSTGHGIPGAFLSMLGSTLLREIVQKDKITETDVILGRLREGVIEALKQKGKLGEQKDGMDMSIITIDHKTNVIQFSGANNPIYILTNNKLKNLEPLNDFNNFYEIKANKMPIAIFDRMDAFTSHEVQLNKGDQIYLFSDGFSDQFGGDKGKKFKTKEFKRVLSENRDRPMKEQKEILNRIFESWKGDLEQLDDVVVLGVKI